MNLRSIRAAIFGVLVLIAGARLTQGQKIPDARPAPASGAFEAAGTVKQLSCRAREVELQVAAATSTVRLHGHAGDFRVVMQSRPANFRLCTSLKGLHVEVRYTLDDSNNEKGTIHWLRVGSPDEPAADPHSITPGEKAGAPMDNLGSKGDPTETQTAEGNVTDVVCTGNEMKVTIAAGNAPLILHTRDYRRVVYDDESAFETPDFEACTKLKGHRASFTYVVVPGKSYSGEIQSIEVGQ